MAWNLRPSQFQTLGNNPDVRTFVTVTGNLIYVTMNMTYPPLAKPEVRDAIRYAIDYDTLIDAILEGAATPIQTIIPPRMLGHNPARPYTHDVAKAKELLAAAGYPAGFDVELRCYNFSPFLEVATKIKADLADAGIRVTINAQSAKDSLSAFKTRNSQLALFQWMYDYADPDFNAKSFAHCASLGNDAPIKLLAWWLSYLTPETSRMADEAARELDTAKRQALYDKITNIIVDDGPYAILYTPLHQYAVRTDVADFVVPSAISLYDLPITQ